MLKNSPSDLKIESEKIHGFWRSIVEDNNDPLKAGRVKIRIHGLHTSKTVKTETEGIPVSELPWAEPAMPIQEGSISGFGNWAVPLQGSQVLVFFENGNINKPIYFASMPGIPESKESYSNSNTFNNRTDGFKDPDGEYPVKSRLGEPDFHRLSRGVSNQTLVTTKNNERDLGVPTALGGSWSEPESPYNAEYPHNQVIVTHGGVTLELDSTPGKTRLHLYHPSNSYIEIDHDGNMVVKNNAEKYEIVMEGKNIHINQQRNITIGDNSKKRIGGDEIIEVVGDKEEEIYGDMNQTIGGDKSEDITADKNEDIGGNKDSVIGINKTEDIGGNKTLTIDGNKSETIGGNKTESITGSKYETIGSDKTENISGDKTENISGDLNITVSGDALVSVTGTATISATTVNITGAVNLANQATVSSILNAAAASLYNSHTHNENGDGGGITDPPNEQMIDTHMTTNTKAS